mmetsp:Transcript_39514/g.113699  ORF Transcript_39514/g.113699 Transcript_39514/m.113699 type:complete len:251 (+) Transcript_39514:120-872(+)|eukprot:CAMPEP_0176099996 /NCGR_PEP_ID=MMETSP0120_2-20121206/50153_1 /TAXON_ID=160619 /ORGANISM="Kryptoperidinium foliaceum, Strain CCMP 1326" /LENGTH=250 /DNA_ID=CAMNT_0017434039 /DNA_START=83 /DNA_END=831 /DNA_ORIENTATION=-
MSDDKILGRCFWFIPRRLYILALATIIFLWGVGGIAWAVYRLQLPGDEGSSAWHARDRCIGSRCQDVLTCKGTRAASFHTREPIALVGGAVFGFWGFLGALNGYIDDLRWFGFYLYAYAALLLALVFADSAYTLICGEYPLNIIDEALLWRAPRLPVREAVKFELRETMVSYPVGFVDKLSQMQVYMFYLLVEACMAAFCVYSGFQSLMVAQFMRHGALGLGAVFDMRDWKERVSLKRFGRDAHGYRSAV